MLKIWKRIVGYASGQCGPSRRKVFEEKRIEYQRSVSNFRRIEVSYGRFYKKMKIIYLPYGVRYVCIFTNSHFLFVGLLGRLLPANRGISHPSYRIINTRTLSAISSGAQPQCLCLVVGMALSEISS